MALKPEKIDSQINVFEYSMTIHTHVWSYLRGQLDTDPMTTLEARTRGKNSFATACTDT